MRWFILLLCLNSTLSQAKKPDTEESWLALKKYGLASCLNSYNHQKNKPTDFTRAMEGYFKMNPIKVKAINDVDSFIKSIINQKYKSQVKENYFLACLDLYESEEYMSTIKKIYINGTNKHYKKFFFNDGEALLD